MSDQDKFNIRHYENNPRSISQRAFERLQETMLEFGDLSGIVHNLETGELIGGNQRSEAAHFINKIPTITETFDPPLEDGTVQIGYFEHQGRRFVYRAVRWEREKADRANLIANAAGGQWDWDRLANFDHQALDAAGFDDEMLTTIKNDVRMLNEYIALKENKAPSGEKVVFDEQWAILIECAGEKEQRELLERFQSEGIKCKALIS